MYKEEPVTTIIMKSCSRVKLIEQYSFLGKRIDLYLPDHKLAIEIDEKDHMIVKNLIYIEKLVKYTITLMIQIKN